MIKKALNSKNCYQAYEHLESFIKNTTYAQRLQWLEEANKFVRAVEKARKKAKKISKK